LEAAFNLAPALARFCSLIRPLRTAEWERSETCPEGGAKAGASCRDWTDDRRFTDPLSALRDDTANTRHSPMNKGDNRSSLDPVEMSQSRTVSHSDCRKVSEKFLPPFRVEALPRSGADFPVASSLPTRQRAV